MRNFMKESDRGDRGDSRVSMVKILTIILTPCQLR